MWTADTEFGPSVAVNPMLTIKEIEAIVSFRLKDILREVRSRGHGVSVIHPAGDQAFPTQRMQAIVKAAMVDGFVSVAGSHNELYLKPHSLTDWIDHHLDVMEQRRKQE